jgi:hypothetical protein
VSEPRYWLGLDLGQLQDYTALAVLERAIPPPEEIDALLARVRAAKEAAAGGVAVETPPVLAHTYHARHLERLPLGTSYPSIVARVGALLATPTLRGCTELVVDATGVGRPTIDLLKQARLAPIAVTITGGDVATCERWDEWHVPKRDLIAQLQVLLQTQRLVVAEGLPESATLVRELLNYQTKITVAGHDTYGAWREGTHDDLVLAVALAAWRAERPRASFGSS